MKIHYATRAAAKSVQAVAAKKFEEMPTPRRLSWIETIAGRLFKSPASRLHLYVDERHRELGPVYKESIGTATAVFVSDAVEIRRTFSLEGKYPMHILPNAWLLYNEIYGCKRGLLFMDGEGWLNLRRPLNRLMLKPQPANYFEAPCKFVAEKLIESWKNEKSKNLNQLEKQLYRWSVDTIIATLLGMQYEVYCQKWTEQAEFISTEAHRIFLESGYLNNMNPKYARALCLPTWNRFVNAVDGCLSTARQLVLEMMSVCSLTGDGLLSHMMNAGLCEEDIVKIVADLILAAGDTTALSTQWALYLLAKNEEVQNRVAKDVRAQTDGSSSLLLRGVVREALRLYPVAPFLTRIIPNPCVIGGYEIPAMQPVILSVYTSSRDPHNFPEPERFWPERWLRDATDGSYVGVKNAYASLPFAMGVRSCIGRKLAETQMTTTLSAVLSSFRMQLHNKEDVEMILRLVAVPSQPIKICLTPL